jgi:6-phosphogluconolactonase
MAKIHMIEDATDAEVANWLATRLEATLSNMDVAAISIPGGSTPFPILSNLVQRPIDWSRVEVWAGDDRIVPEDHPASNTGRMAQLFEPVGAKLARLELGKIPPHFAIVWLGMGADGHIASLFPNVDPRADDALRIRQLTPDPLPPEAPFDRITLTMPALLDSDELLFVARGAGKRALFESAVRGDNDLPVARLLAAARQSVTCFV